VACEASRSSWCWSVTRVCCSAVICGLGLLGCPELGGVVVVVVVEPDGRPPLFDDWSEAAVDSVAPEAVVDDVVAEDSALWAASSLARVAWADARLAWAEVTPACSEVISNDARVWPAVTCWPTETFTALTVPDALKLRLA
jgi:hypothetical protein